MQFARKYLLVGVIGLVGFVAGWVVSRADEMRIRIGSGADQADPRLTLPVLCLPALPR